MQTGMFDKIKRNKGKFAGLMAVAAIAVTYSIAMVGILPKVIA